MAMGENNGQYIKIQYDTVLKCSAVPYFL